MRAGSNRHLSGDDGHHDGKPDSGPNDYDVVVPNSTELVTAFYGAWTDLPGGPTLIQGSSVRSRRPDSDEIVDPSTLFMSNPIRAATMNVAVTANDGTNRRRRRTDSHRSARDRVSSIHLLAVRWSIRPVPTESATSSFQDPDPGGDISIPMKLTRERHRTTRSTTGPSTSATAHTIASGGPHR